MTADTAFDEAETHARQGRLKEAVAAYKQSLSLRPDASHVHDRLGLVLQQQGKLAEALACFRHAVALDLEAVDALGHLGEAQAAVGRPDQAVGTFRRAVAMRPDLAESHYNLGLALEKNRQSELAADSFRKALAIQPKMHQAHANLGVSLSELGHTDDAEAAFRAAMEIRPDYANAHWNLGLSLLRKGDFQNGWPEYEWRWKVDEFAPPIRFTRPRWDGTDLRGRRILIYGEQGFGDVIQFIRYLPQVSARGGRVLVACHPSLHRLFKDFTSVQQWVAADQSMPSHDVYCPLISLPRLFGTTLENIPANIPYLTADPELTQQWQTRLPPATRPRVGLVWAGRHTPDPDRSVPIEYLSPLAQVSSVQFISLQKGIAPEKAQSVGAMLNMPDWTAELKHFADTAALIANLDLVITIDTAVAHLAGAMGKPTWVLLKRYPDWRWMLDRPDSAWYPTMRLFRQPQIGDWQTPIAQIVEALRSL
jgi:tetratricopeptide (TPR) repeat protein